MGSRMTWINALTGRPRPLPVNMIREKEQRFRRRIPSIPEVDCGLDAELVWHRDEFASVGVRGARCFSPSGFCEFRNHEKSNQQIGR